MKSSNHKLLNDAYTLHLIITILLALGGFVTGIAYAIIQENGWLLLAILAGNVCRSKFGLRFGTAVFGHAGRH